ncbi:MAG: GNAT family N-acetyltransferase [Actinomycetota bacterium]|nr:GNAT family N-acetyltransferase [Actinomycetota bacterium]
MLHPDYPIRTERLILRPLVPDDVDAVHAYQSREDVCRYIPYSPRTRAEVAERLGSDRNRSTLDDEGQAMLAAVVVTESDRVVGDVMLAWTSREHRSGEVGYVLNPGYQGQGYATEAAAALLRLGFDGLDLHRIVARVDARNDASVAVLRRIGMRQEAHLVQNEWFKGQWSDELDFAILADEWRHGNWRA